MMSITSKRDQHLQGKRILVTALDLEQREHRGIAVYSKALIRHLRRMGAEVWLLTQFKPMTSDLRQLPKETQRIIYSSRTLNELVHGKTLHISKLEQLIPFFCEIWQPLQAHSQEPEEILRKDILSIKGAQKL